MVVALDLHCFHLRGHFGNGSDGEFFIDCSLSDCTRKPDQRPLIEEPINMDKSSDFVTSLLQNKRLGETWSWFNNLPPIRQLDATVTVSGARYNAGNPRLRFTAIEPDAIERD